MFRGDPGPPPPCPALQILPGADAISAYAPGRQGEAAGLNYVAGLGDPASACRYDGQGVEIDLAFNLLVEQGPAFDAAPVRLTWFIATVAPGAQIQSKQLFTSEVIFPEAQEAAGLREEVTLRVPGVRPDDSARLVVYVGFQLDEASRRPGQVPLIPSAPSLPPGDPGGAPSPDPAQ